MAHRHVVSRCPADGEYALRSRSAACRWQHLVLQHVRCLRRTAGPVEAPDREPQDQARRHLQQRRLSAPGRHRDRRSEGVTGRGAPLGLHPPRHRAAHALSRPPTQCVSRGARTCGLRGLARRALGFRRAAGVRLGARVAGRRSGAVGNRCTMHRRDPFDASARRIMHRTQIKGSAAPL